MFAYILHMWWAFYSKAVEGEGTTQKDQSSGIYQTKVFFPYLPWCAYRGCHKVLSIVLHGNPFLEHPVASDKLSKSSPCKPYLAFFWHYFVTRTNGESSQIIHATMLHNSILSTGFLPAARDLFNICVRERMRRNGRFSTISIQRIFKVIAHLLETWW